MMKKLLTFGLIFVAPAAFALETTLNDLTNYVEEHCQSVKHISKVDRKITTTASETAEQLTMECDGKVVLSRVMVSEYAVSSPQILKDEFISEIPFTNDEIQKMGVNKLDMLLERAMDRSVFAYSQKGSKIPHAILSGIQSDHSESIRVYKRNKTLQDFKDTLISCDCEEIKVHKNYEGMFINRATKKIEILCGEDILFIHAEEKIGKDPGEMDFTDVDPKLGFDPLRQPVRLLERYYTNGTEEFSENKRFGLLTGGAPDTKGTIYTKIAK